MNWWFPTVSGTVCKSVVSFDVTSLYPNIPVTDRLLIIKDYVNYDQFSRKTAILQDKFLGLVNSIFKTTWYTIKSKLCKQNDGVTMGRPASSTKTGIFFEAHE